MRRIGVTAATLVLALVSSGCLGSGENLAHKCTATDKRFLATAAVDLTVLGIWTADFNAGEADAEELAQLAFDAAERIGHVQPRDPSLRTAQRYLDAMYTEYGKAITLKAEGKPAGEHVYRAYGLANFAYDLLLAAQPELERKGCSVATLL